MRTREDLGSGWRARPWQQSALAEGLQSSAASRLAMSMGAENFCNLPRALSRAIGPTIFGPGEARWPREALPNCGWVCVEDRQAHHQPEAVVLDFVNPKFSATLFFSALRFLVAVLSDLSGCSCVLKALFSKVSRRP